MHLESLQLGASSEIAGLTGQHRTRSGGPLKSDGQVQAVLQRLCKGESPGGPARLLVQGDRRCGAAAPISEPAAAWEPLSKFRARTREDGTAAEMSTEGPPRHSLEEPGRRAKEAKNGKARKAASEGF